MKFREWLNEIDEIKYFYNIELPKIEEKIFIIDYQTETFERFNNIIQINEKIIEPHKVKITTMDVNILNKQFLKEKIIFNIIPLGLSGYYDKQTDEINIFFDKNRSLQEIEAILAHELVHKEQHKRSGDNYFIQTSNMVKKINDLALEINSLDMTITGNANILQNKIKERNELVKQYQYLTPYETMAYACQFVKDYKYMNPTNIIKEMEKNKIPVNNLTKKYIAMYWLIRDKI